MNATGLCRAYLKRSVDAESRAAAEVERSQRALLGSLLRQGALTAFGHEKGLRADGGYEAFAATLQPADYEAFRPWVMRMVGGEASVLWPGRVGRFAQSSGTSGGKSKYIPLTERSLARCHFAGARLSAASYLLAHPESRLMGGGALILGGSFANELTLPGRRVKVGDLSASLIDRMNPLAAVMRVPSKSTALMEDWNVKLPKIVEEARRRDVRSLSGVPSWMLTMLRRLLADSGAGSVREVWPRLEVFFHGGIAFGPYRSQYREIMGGEARDINYWENYNASEGFFGVQAREGSRAMRLLMNADTFYEFIPVERADDPWPPCLPAWEVEPGRVYELVVTSSNGLWRYRLGDTVKIEGVEPLEITIAGRTRSFINAFGEEVMVHNTDAALAETCRLTGAEVADYSAAPVYATSRRKGRHQWVIEFIRPPASLEGFAEELDRQLCRQNSDYQAKRTGGLFLDPLEVLLARKGLFDEYLALTGRLGGQRKVPRLRNDRGLMERLLELNEERVKSKVQSAQCKVQG